MDKTCQQIVALRRQFQRIEPKLDVAIGEAACKFRACQRRSKKKKQHELRLTLQATLESFLAPFTEPANLPYDTMRVFVRALCTWILQSSCRPDRIALNHLVDSAIDKLRDYVLSTVQIQLDGALLWGTRANGARKITNLRDWLLGQRELAEHAITAFLEKLKDRYSDRFECELKEHLARRLSAILGYPLDDAADDIETDVVSPTQRWVIRCYRSRDPVDFVAESGATKLMHFLLSLLEDRQTARK